MASHSYAEGQDAVSEKSLPFETKLISQKGGLKVLQPQPNIMLTFDEKVKMCEFGQPGHIPKQNKVLLVVGATGAGKSTLINAMINYLLGVKWEDDIRYQLIVEEGSGDQSVSQTQGITTYTFHHSKAMPLDYSLTIIDTPGFGDTRGKEMDKKITGLLKKMFTIQGKNRIDHIHGVAFVAQAALSRLTESQKYIFDAVLELFGADIEENIFIACTNCDDPDNPNVLVALRKAEVPFETHFGFNNVALYYKPTGTNMRTDRRMKDEWEMAIESFEALFIKFESAKTVSAAFTQSVLIQRCQLQLILDGIRSRLNKVIAKINEIAEDKNALERAKSKAKENENYTYTVTLTKTKKKYVSKGQKATTCKNCETTCDKTCICSNSWKYWCTAISWKGNCTVCKDKCSYKDHVSDYYYEECQEDEIRTSEEVKKKYKEALLDKDKFAKQINKMETDIIELESEALDDIYKSFQCVRKLQRIALKPNIPDPANIKEHITNLIQQEQEQRKVGYEGRIAHFKKLQIDSKKMVELEARGSTWWTVFVKEWTEAMQQLQEAVPVDVKLV